MRNGASEGQSRRVAAHEVVVGGVTLRRCVVEISGGRVTGWRFFSGEPAMTEWIGGRIDIIRQADGTLKAVWNGCEIR